MKTLHLPILITAALAAAFTITSVCAQEKTAGFNQKIPEKIMTPDKVETHFGTLNFVDGVPTVETTPRRPRATKRSFELMGNRGTYDNGWMANTTPLKLPWAKVSVDAPTPNPDDFQWELYHVAEDFSQANNLG